MGTRATAIIAMREDREEDGKTYFSVSCGSDGWPPHMLKQMHIAMTKQKFNHSNHDLVNRFLGDYWQYKGESLDLNEALGKANQDASSVVVFDLCDGEVSLYNNLTDCKNGHAINFVEDQLKSWGGAREESIKNICDFYFWAKLLKDDFELELIGHDDGPNFYGVK